MNLKLKSGIQEYPVFGFSMSLFLHALIFSVAALIMHLAVDEISVGSPYIQINTVETGSDTEPVQSEEMKDETQEMVDENLPEESKSEIKETKPVESETGQNSKEAMFYDFSSAYADTGSLVQVYKESTLDVTLKYPAGWTYIDQNVKNTLDGITFWTSTSNFNPPPYVHIEVQDKDLFDPKKFEHSYKTRNYTAYYNNPEELEGQFTQIIYIRTNTHNDFSLKLIMKGEEAFKKFQPVFFGMVKSFKYGSQFF